MRLALLAVVGSLAVSGCGKEETAANTSSVDQAVSASDFVTNDATAIDAATGADANMAADVDINTFEMAADNGSAGDRGGRASASRDRPGPVAPATDSDEEPAEEPLEPAAPPTPGNSN